MAYFRICPECGAHLDPDEKCDCRDQRKRTEQYFEKRIRADPGTGQMSFRFDGKGGVHEKSNFPSVGGN